MRDRCGFCHSTLLRNRTLERFPFGRRVAYDPARGRLWAVCAACRRWNLAPIEERWEVVEELERLTTDGGRLLSRTGEVALLRIGDLDVIRVGQASLVEEAWWRYGEELVRRRIGIGWVAARRQSAPALPSGEWAEYLESLGLAGRGRGVFLGPGLLGDLIRRQKFGRVAWRGASACRQCGQVLHRMTFPQSHQLILIVTRAELQIELRCEACGLTDSRGGHRFVGLEGGHVLRRVLAHNNFLGAPARRVQDAVSRIEQMGSPRQLIHDISGRASGILSAQVSPDAALALEIAVNEEAERERLTRDVASAEADWREEEELAAIIDGELTEVPAFEELKRLRSPGSDELS
jgi:hypothetical protein